MYKDREKAKAASKERVRRYRALQKGVTSSGELTSEGVTQGVTSGEGVTSIPPVKSGLTFAEKLVDPAWRDRLERITESLGSLGSEVRLGVYGPDMMTVAHCIRLTE